MKDHAIMKGLLKLYYFNNRLLTKCPYFPIGFLVFTVQYILPFRILDIDRNDLSGYHGGTVYLNNVNISAAEMTQYLANIKLRNTNCLTKKYRVPFFEFALKDQTVIKYMARSTRYKDLTLTTYIRYS